MELGRHLVRELGCEGGFDTLGRWMAHYVAELIDKTEKGSTETERIEARKNAFETIIKLWEYRTSLPGKAYPLAQYKDVLHVLEQLRPTNNPFGHVRYHGDTKKDQIAADLFDNLSRLIIALLLTKIPSDEIYGEVNSATTDALNDTERHILIALQDWGEMFMSTDENSSQMKMDKRDEIETEVDLDQAALRLINGLMNNLVKLKNEIEGKDDSS